MRKYYEILRKCPLFYGIENENLIPMLGCIRARVRQVKRDEVIAYEGEGCADVGIVLSGEVQITRTDYEGNRSIVSSVHPSELFGESFACAELKKSPVDIVAKEDGEVMIIDIHCLMHTCSNACEFHNKMIFNLLKAVSANNIALNQKIEIISKRTTREKLIAYLSAQSKKVGKNSFTIPYDRQELADYLEVDRSGLSAEISKLRREGVLECKNSSFKLL